MRNPQGPPPAPAPLPIVDRATFAETFRRFYGPLSRYARRLTGDAASAADVLQDVFLKLWEDRARLAVEVSLSALLYTMVRNRALNHRRRRRWTVDVPEAALSGRSDPAPNGAEAVAADDLRRRLHAWIGELPPRRAEAFMLSRYHGLQHREVAAIMGVSERTVDTHILLALRTLRERLDRLESDEPTP